MNITVTPKAQKYFKDLASAHNARGIWLGLKGGGCAGFEYEWQIIGSEQQVEDSDAVDYNGWQLYVDQMSLVYLLGSNIDYLTDITGSRVVVENPLATSSCGCGTSVSFGV
jgi:iron-sulfur cluster assembly accessory protein